MVADDKDFFIGLSLYFPTLPVVTKTLSCSEFIIFPNITLLTFCDSGLGVSATLCLIMITYLKITSLKYVRVFCYGD